MEELQAAALRVKLNYIAEWTEQRRRHVDTYREHLDGIGDIELPAVMPNARHVYHLFVIRTGKRDALLQYLRDNGIGADLHYPTPLHLQPAYASLGYRKGDFPVAENSAQQILSLPLFPELTAAEISRICGLIQDFFKGASTSA